MWVVRGVPHLIVHFVEFVDQTDPLISEHECTSFKCPFFGKWILMNTSSKTNSRSTFASCVDSARGTLFNIFQEL
jgi:hypothetical protein